MGGITVYAQRFGPGAALISRKDEEDVRLRVPHSSGGLHDREDELQRPRHGGTGGVQDDGEIVEVSKARGRPKARRTRG